MGRKMKKSGSRKLEVPIENPSKQPGAPGRLDGFSIGRYEKKRESFDLNATKFENGAMRFWGKKSPGAGTLSKQGFLPCLSIIKNSQRRTRINSKSLKKPPLRQKDDYTPQVR